MAKKGTPLHTRHRADSIIADCASDDQETRERAQSLRKRLLAEYQQKHDAGTTIPSDITEHDALLDSLNPHPTPPARRRLGKPKKA